MVLAEAVECGSNFPMGQVARSTEDDQSAGSGDIERAAISARVNNGAMNTGDGMPITVSSLFSANVLHGRRILFSVRR